MRPPFLLLALTGLLLASGCAHQPSTVPPPGPEARALPQRLLHVYVDCALPAETPERNQTIAETIALTLRDQLRQSGYDVRGAESAVRDAAAPATPGNPIAPLTSLARAVATGSPPPASSRAATYLHPNSPRLLLVVALTPSAIDRPHRAPDVQLGGFLVDSATGEILWSGRASTDSANTDQDLRRLAGKLLRNLASRPS